MTFMWKLRLTSLSLYPFLVSIDHSTSPLPPQGGFGTALMTKDLGLAQAAATNTQSPTPLGSLSHQVGYLNMCLEAKFILSMT